MARTRGQGNPPWTRDETILALELFLSSPEKTPGPRDERVVSLSQELNAMPFRPMAARLSTYRNPDGVAFKLQNLRQVATGKGLGNVSKIDRDLWAELGAQPAAVRRLARQIRNGIEELRTEVTPTVNESGDDTEFFEGRVLTEIHRRRERSRGLRRALLRKLRANGQLTCALCGATAPCDDQSLDDAIFEVHHAIPLASSAERRTSVKDVVLLCASCHRLIHRLISRLKSWVTVADAKRYLRKTLRDAL